MGVLTLWRRRKVGFGIVVSSNLGPRDMIHRDGLFLDRPEDVAARARSLVVVLVVLVVMLCLDQQDRIPISIHQRLFKQSFEPSFKYGVERANIQL